MHLVAPDPEPYECRCGDPECGDCHPFGLPPSPIPRFRDLYLAYKQGGEYVSTVDGSIYRDVFITLYEYAAILETMLDIRS